MTTTNHTSPIGGELKPCPMCGAKPRLIVGFSPLKSAFVDCECGVTSPIKETDDEAVAIWNRRTPDKPIGEDAANGAMGEREAFEHWCKTHCGLCDRDLHQAVGGAYRSGYVDDMWDGWSARAGLAASANRRQQAAS